MIRLAAIIATFLAICSVSIASALGDKKGFIAIAALPFPGHSKPLHRIGRELVRRGHDVRMLMMKRGHHTASFEKDPYIPFIALGDYETDVCDEDLYSVFVQDLAFNDGPGNLTLGMQCMFGKSSLALKEGLTEYFTNVERPDILISDYASFAATDVGNQLGIPTIVNFPSFQLKTDFFGVPIGSGLSQHQTASLYYRMRVHLFEAVQRLTIGVPLGLLTFNHWDRQEKYGKAMASKMGEAWGKNPIIFNTIVGLDYAQHHGSHHFLSGPILIERESESNITINRENCEDIRPWLNHSERPIIYVSFGTTGSFTSESLVALLEGFKELHKDPRYNQYDILWRIPYSQRPLIVASNDTNVERDLSLSFFPDFIKPVDWLCSQEEVLSHPNVKLFVTHGGANSPWESIRESKPMIVVPSFFDQHDMAVRIHERELGVRIKNPLFCTKQDVLAALYEILEPRKFDTVSKNIKKVRSLLRNAVGNDFAGGAKNAADYIESLMELDGDFSHLLPIQQGMRWWQVQQWDLIGLYTTILSSITALVAYKIGARSTKRGKTLEVSKIRKLQ
ncbi:hypothetical protein VKS41_000079 [Umbelopsis sp. WA50703]